MGHLGGRERGCAFILYNIPAEAAQREGTAGQVSSHLLPEGAVGAVLPSEHRGHRPGSPGRQGTAHQLPVGRQEMLANPVCDPAHALPHNPTLEVEQGGLHSSAKVRKPRGAPAARKQHGVPTTAVDSVST